MSVFAVLLRALLLSFLSIPCYALNKAPIEGQWKFQYGDNPNWSSPSLNDEHWPTIKIPSLLSQQHNQAITGWYRVRFDHPEIENKVSQALLIDYLRHADESWLNGQKIGGKGHFNKPWEFKYTNPQGLIRVYHIPPALLQAKDNVLAIKVSIGFAPAWGGHVSWRSEHYQG